VIAQGGHRNDRFKNVQVRELRADSASVRALIDLAVGGSSLEDLWSEALRSVSLDLEADAGVAMSVIGSDCMCVASPPIAPSSSHWRVA
jgi:hypothetical protein